MLDGHLIAVDSSRVQDQVATSCPEQFARFVGGTEDERRLSMLRTVWFTPTVEESDTGANWYRCDVIALAADEQLAPLTGILQGVLTRSDGRDRYAMCGTAEPGTPEFSRVICSAEHSWRAIATVPFEEGKYPGLEHRARRRPGPVRGHRSRRRGRPAGLPVGLRVAHRRAVGRRPDLRLLLGARLSGELGTHQLDQLV